MNRVLIADDHPLFRDALRGAVRRALPGSVVLEVDSVGALIEVLEHPDGPELLLLDLAMPGANGFSALVHVRAVHPGVPVVEVSAREDADTVRRAIAHGATAFVPKSADLSTLVEVLARVVEGETWTPRGTGQAPLGADEARVAQALSELTPAQFRVLGMVCAGLLNKQIAYELSITEATVKAHMSAVLRKLGVHTRTQAVMLAARLALDPDAVRAPPDDEG